MGIYYIAPLLGPSIGPILGGVLTTGLHWRAIFWFLAIVAGATCLCFVFFFHDTFRRERSLTYQNVLKQRLRATDVHTATRGETKSSPDKLPKNTDPEKNVTPAAARPGLTPVEQRCYFIRFWPSICVWIPDRIYIR